MIRPVLFATVGLVLTAAVVAATTAPVISQRGRVFEPREISVPVGAVVRVDNDDDVLHHVYVESPNFNFDSGEQPPGRQVAIRFTARGTFDVQCEIHPKMRLRVRVD
jgi:plastocyanin